MVKQQKDKNQMALVLDFTQMEISPPADAKLPTLLSQSPFFKPGQDRKKSDTKGWDDNDGESFRVGDIEWIRFGPGLDTYDLETLVAVIQLINVKAKASRSNFKIIETALADGINRTAPKSFEELHVEDDVLVRGEENVKKQFGVTTATTINRYVGRSCDADSLEYTRASVRRLARNRSTFINHLSGREDESIPFFNMTTNRSGAFVISFPPEMNFLLMKLMTFNLDIYRKLPPVGKAMMLWMNPLSGKHDLTLEAAKKATNYEDTLSEFKRLLVKGHPSKGIKSVFDRMIESGFLKSAEVTGTGRKVAFHLHFERP